MYIHIGFSVYFLCIYFLCIVFLQTQSCFLGKIGIYFVADADRIEYELGFRDSQKSLGLLKSFNFGVK